MARIYEDPALRGKPGLHAFIVGASSYPFLTGGAKVQPNTYGMRQLSAAATSADRVWQWIRNNSARLATPLATCRLLLSPSPSESGLTAPVEPATLANFLRDAAGWREDARTHRDNATLFYFAGHGIQRDKDDSLLLLEDFNEPGGGILRNAVDMHTLGYGMSPSKSQPDIARTQLYFIDACRLQPEDLRDFERQNPTAVFTVELNGRDDRSAPVFYAALPNSAAYAVPDWQNLFSMALLKCLDGAGAESVEDPTNGTRRWRVSVYSLTYALQREMRDLKNRLGGDQEFVPSGAFLQAPICYFPAAPSVDITLVIDPAAASKVCELEVVNWNGVSMHEPAPLSPHPYSKSLPAGSYYFNLRFQPGSGYVPVRKVEPIFPPRWEWTAKVL